MNFGKVNRIILFGGSRLLAETAKALSKIGKYEIVVFSSARHLNEVADSNERPLKDILRASRIKFFNEKDINVSRKIDRYIDEDTLGIAMGAPWVFSKKFVRKFKKPLLDFMGIDLPRYRGGAHYTWQILLNNRKGGCNLQVIEGGKDTFHRGSIIKRKEYRFDNKCLLPVDYFNYAVPIEKRFILEFLKEVEQNKYFKSRRLNEQESSYYPFLHTRTNGWIDWSWDIFSIERFIRAFDDPYDGASTTINGKRIFLKKAAINQKDGDVHPFAVGLVVYRDDRTVKILSKGGILTVREVLDERKKDILGKIKLGNRFFTLPKKLKEAKTFNTVYNAEGLE